MKPLLVVNPSAAAGRAGRTFPAVRRVIETAIGPVDVALTEGPGHAIDLARQAASAGRSLVIAVGGDGTFHEVANGVLDAGERRTAVGYVGQGTGGDFRRSLGIEDRLDRYVEAIAGGRERLVDAGKVRYRALDGAARSRWFVNILSAGMSGLVDGYVARTPKAFGGRAAYFAASARALVRCRRVALTCEMGLGGSTSAWRGQGLLIAICNGSYFGAGMHVAPMASPDDGRFDVVTMNPPTKLALVGLSRRIYQGRHMTAPGVAHFACDRIHIDVDDERARSDFPLDVDGEPLGTLPVDVELARGSLRVRAPAPSPS